MLNQVDHDIKNEVRPKSGFFKDKKGLSMDKKGDRQSDEECIQHLKRNLNSVDYVVKLSDKCFRNHQLKIVPNPLPTNEYHVLLVKEEHEPKFDQNGKLINPEVAKFRLSGSQATFLKKECEVLEP